jgi:hypothetical protein
LQCNDLGVFLGVGGAVTGLEWCPNPDECKSLYIQSCITDLRSSISAQLQQQFVAIVVSSTSDSSVDILDDKSSTAFSLIYF